MSMYCFHKLGFTIFDTSEKLVCAVINFVLYFKCRK